MPVSEFSTQIIRTLLYYDIFNHPLTTQELYCLLPQNSLSRQTFTDIAEWVDAHSAELTEVVFG